MRNRLITGLIASHLVAAPAAAADMVADPAMTSSRSGAFAGARLRVALGGGEQQRLVRAGLVMAPTVRSQGSDRRSILRFGEGIELGVRQGSPLGLSIAGRPVTGPEARRLSGPRAGVSTIGWIAIGTGVALVAGTLLLVDAMNDASE